MSERGDTAQGSRWQNFLLATAVFLTLALLVEGGTRLLLFLKYGQQNQGRHWLFTYEPYLIHSDGERSPFGRSFPRDSGALRVLLVGGSTAASFPVAKLEGALRNSLGRNVQVINFGQGGYILNQERIAFLLYGVSLKPDLLVTLDGANDFVTLTKTARVGLPYADSFVRFAVEHPVLNGVLAPLRHSQFVNLLNKLRERNAEVAIQSDEAKIQLTVDHVREALNSMTFLARGAGIAHVMVVQPYLHLAAGETNRDLANAYGYRKGFMVSAMTRLQRSLGAQTYPEPVVVLDGNVALRSPGAYFVDEVHLTPTGYDSLATYIATAVRDGKLLDRAHPPHTQSLLGRP